MSLFGDMDFEKRIRRLELMAAYQTEALLSGSIDQSQRDQLRAWQQDIITQMQATVEAEDRIRGKQPDA